MSSIPMASGPVYSEDNIVNLYYLNELYQEIARHVSIKMREAMVSIFPWRQAFGGGPIWLRAMTGVAKEGYGGFIA